jgi:hypothetical protein
MAFLRMLANLMFGHVIANPASFAGSLAQSAAQGSNLARTK